ncbi:MAG: NrdH-redoxin, partial [Candidatus Competibacteraceae bacterium]|nr:NrdH-redoxin [Candidatus Competibacteraceae bacterium]
MRVSDCGMTGQQPVKVIVRCWIAVFFLLLAMPWMAAPAQEQSVVSQNVLQVFVRDGCPHCAEAKKYLKILASERPDLPIVLR